MDSQTEEENPNNKKHLRKSKWAIMLFSSFLLMGDYFAYDVPFAIKEDLRAKFGNLSNEEFNTNFDHLYIVYLLPNIFLPLLNGILTEKVLLTFLRDFKKFEFFSKNIKIAWR